MIELTVNDMTCGHCASTITKTVKAVDPAAKPEIDLDAKRVRIESSHPASEFVAAITEAGYTPVPAGQAA